MNLLELFCNYNQIFLQFFLVPLPSPLAFLEVKIKVPLRSIKLCQPPFRKTPKTFNSVDMNASSLRKLIGSMIHSEVPAISNIHQSIVASPAIGIQKYSQCSLFLV